MRKPLYRSPSSRTIAWAVYLGANTARRLSREWRLSRPQARRQLAYACRAGYLVRVGHGVYEAVQGHILAA